MAKVKKELIYKSDVRHILLHNHPEAAYYVDRIRVVDAKEVVRAKWVAHSNGSGTCQHCHHHQLLTWDYDNHMHYCPHCGAEMIGVESDGRM